MTAQCFHKKTAQTYCFPITVSDLQYTTTNKTPYLSEAMDTKNASHKFTFSLNKFVSQMILFCRKNNKLYNIFVTCKGLS